VHHLHGCEKKPSSQDEGAGQGGVNPGSLGPGDSGKMKDGPRREYDKKRRLTNEGKKGGFERVNRLQGAKGLVWDVRHGMRLKGGMDIPHQLQKKRFTKIEL